MVTPIFVLDTSSAGRGVEGLFLVGRSVVAGASTGAMRPRAGVWGKTPTALGAWLKSASFSQAINAVDGTKLGPRACAWNDQP